MADAEGAAAGPAPAQPPNANAVPPLFPFAPNEPNAAQQRQQQRIQSNTVSLYRVRLFHAIYYRTSIVYGRRVSPLMRRVIEMFFLLLALGSFASLAYIHVAFTQSPSTCLDHVRDVWPRDGILRVEIVAPEMQQMLDRLSFDQMQCHPFGRVTPIMAKRLRLQPDQCAALLADQTPMRLPGNRTLSASLKQPPAEQTSRSTGLLGLLRRTLSGAVSLVHLKLPETTVYRHRLANNESMQISWRLFDADPANKGQMTSEDFENGLYPMSLIQFEHEMLNQVYRVEYSLMYGYLRLSEAVRRQLRIPVMTVRLNPANDSCFGDALSRLMLNEFLGYGDLLMTSVKSLAEHEDNRGFLRNCITGDHFRFVSVWSQGSYVMAFFVMLLFTVSISMLLRFSHHQIFVCILDLLQMMDSNGRFGFALEPLFTVILALVGMEAIMSEFFNDTTTAFYIILTVWISDQYYANCCHTAISKRHWLRFFYLYHFTFYAYHYRFNGQCSSLALWTSTLFILHSMIYFFHHYELPSVMHHRSLQDLIRNPQAGAAPNQQQPADNAEPQLPNDTNNNAAFNRATIERLLRQSRLVGHLVNMFQRTPAREPGAPSFRATLVTQMLQNVRQMNMSGILAESPMPIEPTSDDDDSDDSSDDEVANGAPATDRMEFIGASGDGADCIVVSDAPRPAPPEPSAPIDEQPQPNILNAQ